MPDLFHPALPAESLAGLKKAEVPLESLEDACRGCELDEVEDYSPKNFKNDTSSNMLGTMQNYSHMVLVSTRTNDWERDVSESPAGLPHKLCAAWENRPRDSTQNGAMVAPRPGLLRKLTGVFSNTDPALMGPGIYSSDPADSDKITVLNSSHCHPDEDKLTVVVLPDFKLVELANTDVDAASLVKAHLSRGVPRAGQLSSAGNLRSWPLPHRAVICICSHKKRDNKCSIAAKALSERLYYHLESHNIEVDEKLDDFDDEPNLESWYSDDQSHEGDLKRTQRFDDELKGVKRGADRVALCKVSHVGGHKFAGIVIIYFPNGSCVWYGRVRPGDIGAIVETTILGGKVIPELLRGAKGVDHTQSILSW